MLSYHYSATVQFEICKRHLRISIYPRKESEGLQSIEYFSFFSFVVKRENCWTRDIWHDENNSAECFFAVLSRQVRALSHVNIRSEQLRMTLSKLFVLYHSSKFMHRSLSRWLCYRHEYFQSEPSIFVPSAIAKFISHAANKTAHEEFSRVLYHAATANDYSLLNGEIPDSTLFVKSGAADITST